MSTYARPASLDDALALLAEDGAAPFGGGTDLAGQVDRGIRTPALLVDLRDAGLGTIDEADGARSRLDPSISDSASARASSGGSAPTWIVRISPPMREVSSLTRL